MEVAPVAILVGAGLFLLGYSLRAPMMVSLFGSVAFGSLAIATLSAVGGAVVLLYVPIAGLFVASVLLQRFFWSDLARVFTLHWTPAVLVILVAYAVVSAFIFPRLFAGETSVFVPMQEGAVIETVLTPVSGNLNQVGYFFVGILSFFAVSVMMLRQNNYRSIKTGFLAFAALNAILGLVDLFGKASGAGDLLSPLRTADYAMLVNVQFEGFWRIVGGYPEASAFAKVSLVALAFTFSYWRATGSRLVLALWSVLLFLLVFSTSTTAYAGLAVLLLIFGISWLWRLLTGRLSRRDMALLVVMGVGLATVLGLFLFGDGRLEPTARLVEASVLEKADSASGTERLYWNQKSWMAFLDTYGLGVGLGSSKASSSFIAILSQLGVAGALLFGLIFIDVARPVRRPPELADAELVGLCEALRSAGVAIIVAGAISSGGADPGILFYITLAGLLIGRARLSESAEQRGLREDSEHLPHQSGRVMWRRRIGGIAEEYVPAGHGPIYPSVTGAPTRLSEADWAAVLAVFRACLPRRGGKGKDDRAFLEAMLHLAVHSVSWRTLPKEFGNWNSIWKRYWRLSRAGVFDAFFDRLATTGRTAHLTPVFDLATIRGEVSSAEQKGAGARAKPSTQ